MNIDIGKAFTFAINRIQANPVYYIVGFLIIGGISFAIWMVGGLMSGIFSIFVGLLMRIFPLPEEIVGFVSLALNQLCGILLMVLLSFVIAPFYVGFFKGIKKEYEGGIAEIGDVFSALDIFIPSALNYVVAVIIVSIGYLCCIIPGILLGPIIPLSIFYLAHGKISGFDALKNAFNTLKNTPILILWTFVVGIFAALGLLLCCVGVFITVPIAMTVLYVLYMQANGDNNLVEIKSADTV